MYVGSTFKLLLFDKLILIKIYTQIWSKKTQIWLQKIWSKKTQIWSKKTQIWLQSALSQHH